MNQKHQLTNPIINLSNRNGSIYNYLLYMRAVFFNSPAATIN